MGLNLGLIFLYGLADDLGLDAGDLRHALNKLAAEAISRPTLDQNAGVYPVSGTGTGTGEVKLNDTIFTSLPFAGDSVCNRIKLNGGYQVTVTVPAAHVGLFWQSEEGRAGLDYVIQGDADDDDAAVQLEVAGMLPDNRVWRTTLQGRGVIGVERVLTDTLELTFINSGTSAAVIYLSGEALRVSNKTAEGGRAKLAARGVPVGRAAAILAKKMVDVSEAVSIANADAAVAHIKGEGAAAIQAAVQKKKQKVASVLAAPAKAAAEAFELFIDLPAAREAMAAKVGKGKSALENLVSSVGGKKGATR